MVQLTYAQEEKSYRVVSAPAPGPPPQYEPSLPVEHSEIAIRLNQDIFRIKIEKQANKEIMYADDILLLASLPSTLESFERTKRNEDKREEAFYLSRMTDVPAVVCPA